MGFFSAFFNSSKDNESEQAKAPAKPVERTRADLEASLSVRYEDIAIEQTSDGCGCREKIYLQRRKANAYEKMQLKQVLDLIESVPAGKALLEETAKKGYNFSFETFDKNCDGCLYAPAKTVMLNPSTHSGIAAMAATAFHELTHAVQNEKTNNLLANGTRLNIADQIKFHRASEAAAWAEEAKFIYQIKDRHPEVLKHAGQVPMYQAFAKEMETSGNVGKAGEAAFKAWYGFRCFQGAYEKQHIANIASHLKTSIFKREDKAFQQSMSSAEVLDKVFVSPELRRGINPEFLTQKETFSISREGAEKLQTLVKNYVAYVPGAKEDFSVGKMFETEKPSVVRKEPEKPKSETAIRFSPDDLPADKAAAFKTERTSSLMTSLTSAGKKQIPGNLFRDGVLKNRIAGRG